MADYLARIAAAATGTTMQAKPPVSGPSLLPGPPPSGMLYPAHIAHGEEVPTLSDIPGTQMPLPDSSDVLTQASVEETSSDVASMKSYASIEEEQPIAAPMAAISNPPTILEAQESVLVQGLKPATSDAALIIRAPRALRHPALQSNTAQFSDVKHIYQKEQSDVLMPPIVSTDTSQPSYAPPPSHEQTDKIPTSLGISLLQAPIEQSSKLPPATAPQITQPQQWGPPNKTMPDQGNNAPSTQGMQAHIQTAQKPAEQGLIPQGATHPLPIKKGELSKGSISMMPASRMASRQVRLSIGRLDVQVNNHPPAPSPERSIPAVNPSATDALEQHYLDRFHLKI
jgi:hypothetical protein